MDGTIRSKNNPSTIKMIIVKNKIQKFGYLL